MANCCARAAERTDTARRDTPSRNRGRCGMAGPSQGIPAGARAIGLDHWPQPARRHPLGYAQCRRNSQTRAELAALAPDAILAAATSSVLPLLQATRTV